MAYQCFPLKVTIMTSFEVFLKAYTSCLQKSLGIYMYIVELYW